MGLAINTFCPITQQKRTPSDWNIQPGGVLSVVYYKVNEFIFSSRMEAISFRRFAFSMISCITLLTSITEAEVSSVLAAFCWAIAVRFCTTSTTSPRALSSCVVLVAISPTPLIEELIPSRTCSNT